VSDHANVEIVVPVNEVAATSAVPDIIPEVPDRVNAEDLGLQGIDGFDEPPPAVRR
jgi:hypothetical protein